MKKPPLRSEYVLLGAFAAQMVFMLYLAAFGTWGGTANAIYLGFLTLAILVLAVAAAKLIVQRRPAGALLCMVFYVAQVLQWSGEQGSYWSFQFFPTITIRLTGDGLPRVELNLLALALLVVAIVAWRARRDIDASAATQDPAVVEPEVPGRG